MKDQELLELKGWGHQLINVLAENRKITKSEVYILLSKNMKVKKWKTHFATMGEDETRRTVNTLLRLIKEKQNTKKKLAKIEYHAIKLANKKVSQKEIKDAIARLPKRGRWWHKLVFWK